MMWLKQMMIDFSSSDDLDPEPAGWSHAGGRDDARVPLGGLPQVDQLLDQRRRQRNNFAR